MTTRATTFCDACGKAMGDDWGSNSFTVDVTDMRTGANRPGFKLHKRHACSTACLPAVLRVGAFPELGLTHEEQKPPASAGVYR